jgi:hypothetical protein
MSENLPCLQEKPGAARLSSVSSFSARIGTAQKDEARGTFVFADFLGFSRNPWIHMSSIVAAVSCLIPESVRHIAWSLIVGYYSNVVE